MNKEFHGTYHVSNANTLVSLPAMIAQKRSTQSLISPGSGATLEASRAPKTEGIRISPMRLVAIQATRRATTPTDSRETLKNALSQVFMQTMAWFSEHDEATMDKQLTRALQRIHDGSRGLFMRDDLLFADLRLVALSPASKDTEVDKAIQAAEQALLQ